MLASVANSNRKVMMDAEPGDQIEFKRGVYSHWAIFVGAENVIHLAGDDAMQLGSRVSSTSCCGISGMNMDKATVRKDHFMKVAGNSPAVINNSKDKRFRPKPKADILKYAKEQIGKKGYNLIFRNCEHFVSYCRYRISKSEQVERVATYGSLTGLFAMILAVILAIFGRRGK